MTGTLSMTEKHVWLGDRHFIVKLDAQGPRIVYERVLCYAGEPWQCYANKSYWHRNHPRASRLVRDVLAAVSQAT